MTATSFANKIGAIGINLLPMLLVERQIGIAQSSLVLGATKSMGLVATLLGGMASDRVPTKTLVVVSFVLSAIGMIGLGASDSVWWIASSAMLAQLGTSLFQAPARLMLTELTPGHGLQEGIAWLRTANNLGQVVSYGIGALFSSWGLAVLMFYDATTSLLAAVLGGRWIPRSKKPHRSGTERVPSRSPEIPRAQIRPTSAFWLTSAMLFGSSMIYELFLSGAAGQYRAIYGEQGVRIFSQGMVINTILCSLFAVVAARYFERPSRLLPIGLALQAVGGAVATVPVPRGTTLFYVGMFLLTAGEILFASVSQATLMRLLPEGTKTGTYYGLAMTIQVTGRIIGSAVAFPLVVHGPRPDLAFLGLVLPFVVLGVTLGGRLDARPAGLS